MPSRTRNAEPVVPVEPLFISYRRSDSRAHAEQLHQRLEDWFGAGSTFLDSGSIEAGAVFPKKLERAVEGAKAVIVVLGPTWLTVLKERAANPAEVDYVRIEVEAALKRHAAGSLPLLLPLLVDGADMAMLGAAHLPPAAWPSLAPLASVNALALRSSTWEPDFTALRTALADATGLKPAPGEAPAATLARIAAAVRKLIDRETLKPLKAAWGADPVTLAGTGNVLQLMADFGKALKAARDDLQATPARTAAVREACRAVLSLLYQLAIDPAAAREWGQPAASPQPVPALSAGTVAMVWAVASGADVRIADQPAPNGFAAERSADLGHIDAGIGDDRRAFAHAELWRLLYPQQTHPGTAGRPLAGATLQSMKDFLSAQRLLDQGYILSGVVGTSKRSVADFAEFGAELNVAALGRTGTASGLLSVDEGKLNTMVYAILLEIEKIQ